MSPPSFLPFLPSFPYQLPLQRLHSHPSPRENQWHVHYSLHAPQLLSLLLLAQNNNPTLQQGIFSL